MRVRRWAVGVAVGAMVASGAVLGAVDRAAATPGVSSAAGGTVAVPAVAPRAVAGATVLGFADLPVDTTITDQYADRGIRFAGAGGAPDPFISPDGSSPTSPVLSGSPRFTGAIAGSFVLPGTTTPARVDSFALDVGYIDEAGSVAVTVYDAGGARLGVLTANTTGIVRLTSTFSGASRFVVASVGTEPAGFEIDNLSFTITRRLAALGDSYSSGEGAGSYGPTAGGCDRGAQAWPRLLAGPGSDVELVAHAACSGAPLAALTLPFRGEAAQLRRLVDAAPAADLVTVTLGGSDVDLAGVLEDCWLTSCVADGRLDGTARRVTRLRAALARAYRQVRAAAPGAEVVAVGYPRLFPATAPEVRGCGWLDDDERIRLNALAGTLEEVQRAAAGAAGVRFVSVLPVLAGHEACGGAPWVYEIGLFGGPQRGHPLAAGQRAIATWVRAALDAT